MSADDMAEFYVHTVTVETFLGTNGYGEDTFAAPVALYPDTSPPNGCLIDEARRLVRGADNETAVSETTIYTYPANRPLFVTDSRVTVNGIAARVITVAVHDSRELDLPDHIAVHLT